MADHVATLNSIQLDAATSSEARRDLIKAARQLLNRLETPTERLLDICLQPFTFGAQITLVQSGLFQSWVKEGGGPRDLASLANTIRADPVLLDRLLRLLAAEQKIDQVEPLVYQMNDYTKFLAREDAGGLIETTQNIYMPAASHMPAYLASLNYQNPTDALNTCFIQTTDAKRDTHVFPWLMSQPALEKHHNQAIALISGKQAWWTDVYPVEQILPATVPTSEVTIVDVGGGFGTHLEKFRQQFDGRHGRLILQDLPTVIPLAQVSEPIEATAYDFFTPQPIIGARVYCLRNVLHDWPLEKAQIVLRTQKAAMRAGHSEIFIHERIVPDMDASHGSLTLDMIMMTLGSAIERTKPQWDEVINGAGLQIKKIWPMETPGEFIIVCDAP